MNIFNLQETIGNTPLVKITLDHLNPKVQLYGKLEGHNPGGSVKDRAAYYMIKGAMDEGRLHSGDTIIEATSGNTGIALAMIAQLFGINIILLMPETATIERVNTMKAYGAKVILTPAEGTIEYSRQLAAEMAEEHGYIILDQFNNPHNKLAHIETTGPEIWRDSDGQVTHFVSSMGTTGTITGTSTFLKSQNQSIQIIGAQPTEGSRIPGIRKWSPAFLPGIYESERVDSIQYVSTAEAIAAARSLAKEHGIFAGMSSGGAFHIAKQLAKELEEGFVVFIVCDRGDRYLSSTLFQFDD